MVRNNRQAMPWKLKQKRTLEIKRSQVTRRDAVMKGHEASYQAYEYVINHLEYLRKINNPATISALAELLSAAKLRPY